MKIAYYNAPCGAGKSFQAADKMTSIPGRYLVVRDRVEAIQSYSQTLYEMAHRKNVSIPIERIVAVKGQSVRVEVEDIPNRFDSLDHVIVLITHKAMMMCDFSGFAGWHIIIDETPVIMDRQDLQTARSQAFFETHYDLTHEQGSWHSVTLKRAGWNTTPADLENDDCLRLLRVFHERVIAASKLPEDATARMARLSHQMSAGVTSTRAVIGNLTEWADMADGRRWTWWSLWSPQQLAPFSSITIMANGFEQSITFMLLKALHPDIEWEAIDLPSSRAFVRRKVVIQYFTERHVASATLFDSEQGQDNLKAITRHLSGENQIWMANDRHADALIGIGRQLRPHQAGSNDFAGYHAATAIYAAKPSGETRAVMKLLMIDPEVWTKSHEYEAILQFVCRTSVRDPNSDATVALRVYDRDQADYLKAYFDAQPHCAAELELVDLGFAGHHNAKAGRPMLVLSAEEAEAKKVAAKAKAAQDARERRAREKAAKAKVGA